MKNKTLPILLTALIALSALSTLTAPRTLTATSPAPAQVKWQTSLKEGLARARRVNRPVLVNVYAVWCGYCKKLRRQTYPAQEVRQEAARFVFIDINGEHYPEIMRKYSINGFPAILFMDKNGYLLDRINGFVNGRRLARKMRDVQRRAGFSDALAEGARKNPDRVLANYKLGTYYTEIGSIRLARKYYLQAWRAKWDDAPGRKRDALYNAAVGSMQLNEHKEALTCWDAYLSVYGDVADADYIYGRYYRGMSLKRLGKSKRARADLLYAGQNLPSARDRQLALRALESLK